MAESDNGMPKDPDKQSRERPPQRRRPRHSSGLRAIAGSLPQVTRQALGRRGLALGGLLIEWPNVVGSEIAARCRPEALAPARQGRRDDGTLTLRVDPGFALEAQHLAPLLLERINGYFGYRAVARLRLQQAPIGRGSAARPASTAEAARPLAPAEEAALHDQVAAVADEELRAALERLGRAVRRDHRA